MYSKYDDYLLTFFLCNIFFLHSFSNSKASIFYIIPKTNVTFCEEYNSDQK